MEGRLILTTKKCAVCKETKCVADFDRSGIGLSSRCKSCQKEKNKRYRELNKESLSALKHEWYNDNKDKILEQKKEGRNLDPRLNMLSTAKHRAKIKNLPFEITVDDILIPDFCPILKIKLQRGEGKATNNSPSLDKIIPELGYVVGNIQVISKLANSMKTNASVDQLVMFSEWVLNNFKGNYDR